MKKSVFLHVGIRLLSTAVVLLFLCAAALAAEPVRMKIGLNNEPGPPRV